MKKPQRFTLMTQLIVGFIAANALVFMMMYAGNRMLERSSLRLISTLEQHVRPLSQLHALQSQFSALRNHELALAQMHDVFAVQAKLTQLHTQIADLDEEFRKFAATQASSASIDIQRLTSHWDDYRNLLNEQARHAAAMDFTAVMHITESRTHIPYLAIHGLLRDLARQTGENAENAYQQATDEQAMQRRDFLILVLLCGLVVFVGLAYSGKTVVRRIAVLRQHALKLARGEADDYIALSRHDEIGDLATSFETMREQVRSRETALEAARSDLEMRVHERTIDLEQANRGLIRFSQVVEQNPVGILIARIDGPVEFVNPAYCRITGRTPDALIGRPLIDVIQLADAQDAATALRTAGSGGIWEVEQSGRRESDAYWERLRLGAIHDERGAATHLLLAREDSTEQHQQMEKITHQAHFDMLTGLPNRVLANDRLQQAVSRCRRDGGKVAALFIDLDNFKEINDTLGHATGDQLLRQVADRLTKAVRAGDVVARLGGDEFLIVATTLEHSDDAASIAEKVLASFTSSFTIDEREITTSPSIGVALYPDDGTEPMVLLRNADLAMYEAKEFGRNNYRFYNKSIHDQSLRRLEVGRCLRGALERDELHVVYHPLVLANNGRVIGAEALLRWNNPELGNVSPAEFIPVAEQNGLIIDIGHWVLREACATLARWRLKQPAFVMAVNVSPRQVRASGFIGTIRKVLKDYKLPPQQLEIELTEGLLLRNQAEVKTVLNELHALGVRLSMDDFGTGYSSLSYLREFPFHTVKIDRSFVRDVTEDASDRALITAAIRMAQALGLQIVAEGVEHQEQWSFLAAQECDILQGFHFGQPVTEQHFGKQWLNASVATPPVAPVVTQRSATTA